MMAKKFNKSDDFILMGRRHVIWWWRRNLTNLMISYWWVGDTWFDDGKRNLANLIMLPISWVGEVIQWWQRKSTNLTTYKVNGSKHTHTHAIQWNQRKLANIIMFKVMGGRHVIEWWQTKLANLIMFKLISVCHGKCFKMLPHQIYKCSKGCHPSWFGLKFELWRSR